MPECPKCRTQMRRIGFEQHAEKGVVAEFECPSCHNRVLSGISRKRKSPF